MAMAPAVGGSPGEQERVPEFLTYLPSYLGRYASKQPSTNQTPLIHTLSHPLRSLGQDAAAAAKLSKGTPDSDYWSNPRKAVNPSGPYLYVTTYSRRVGYSMSDT